MSSSKAWDNSALAVWMASRYLGSMATSPDNGGEGRDWFCLKRRCHDSGRKKSTYQRSLITPGYSRTAIYQQAERVVQAVASEQASGISYEDLWAEHARLKAENEALWQAWSETE